MIYLFIVDLTGDFANIFILATSKVSIGSMLMTNFIELYAEESSTQYKQTDHYWRYVGKLVWEDGQPNYTQLFVIAKYILLSSHGNAVPEKGFSINQKLIEGHGTALNE